MITKTIIIISFLALIGCSSSKLEKSIDDISAQPIEKLVDGWDQMINSIKSMSRDPNKLKHKVFHLKVILSGVDNGIAFIKQNKFVWINKAFTDILGWTEVDVLNSEAAVINFLRIKDIYPIVKEEIEKSGVSRFEYSIVSKEDKSVPCFVSISPISGSGLLTEYIVSIADISTLREKEALLETILKN